MTYWQLFYHIIWTTKNRESSIDPKSMPSLHNAITAKATRMNVRVHAIGGVADHVHVIVSVPPTIALSDLIGKLKGSSSHFVNHQLAVSRPFIWQSEYGVLSFDGKLLDKMVQYVRNQQHHHQEGTTIPVLERVASREPHARSS